MNEPVCGAVSLTDQRHCRYHGDRHHDTTHSLTTEESFVDLSDFRCCWFNFWCYHRATTAVVSAQIESQTMPRKFLLAWQVYEYDERWRWFWNIFHSAVFFYQAELTLWKAIETISEPKSNRENNFHSLSYNLIRLRSLCERLHHVISHRPRENTEQQNRQKKKRLVRGRLAASLTIYDSGQSFNCGSVDTPAEDVRASSLRTINSRSCHGKMCLLSSSQYCEAAAVGCMQCLLVKFIDRERNSFSRRDKKKGTSLCIFSFISCHRRVMNFCYISKLDRYVKRSDFYEHSMPLHTTIGSVVEHSSDEKIAISLGWILLCDS